MCYVLCNLTQATYLPPVGYIQLDRAEWKLKFFLALFARMYSFVDNKNCAGRCLVLNRGKL
jgi:hypothetical protein